LKTLLGLDLNRAVEIRGDLAAPPVECDAAESEAQALAARPELSQLRYQSRMAAELVKIARASALPTLAVAGTYNVWGDRFSFRRGTWQSYYTINLVLTVPIFNGFSVRSQVGQTQAALRELDWNQKGLAEMVKFEVRQALLNFQQAKESLLSQEKNVEEAQESVRIAELNFSEGLATSLDVSSAQVALAQARTNYAQAQYDYVMALAQLDKARGVDDNVPREME